MMEIPKAMFKKLFKELEIEVINAKLDSEEKTREQQRKIKKHRNLGYEVSKKLYC